MDKKLELTWYGKDEKIEVEPRILLEEKQKSFRQDPPPTLIENVTSFDNLLIHGDNLLALKALEHDFAGQVKCAYIDPPYNTGSAFTTYNDNLQHSTWLSLMRPRIQAIWNLLDKDFGSLWISIDDDEQAYLKVLCDEIFGRSNFVANVIWQKRYSPQNAAKWLSDSHDFIMVYAKNKLLWHPHLLGRTDEMNSRYKNPDNDPRGPWKPSDSTAQAGHGTASQFYTLIAPNGTKHDLPAGRCWLYTEKVMQEKIKDHRIWFGPTGDNVPAVKKFLTEVKQGVICQTIWSRDEVGDNQEAKREIKAFHADTVFDTPKPERLIERILNLATNPGDLVLDSFLGSGTTAAVAQKMNRRWIGVELTDVAYTYDKPRLDMVLTGKDSGGITKECSYQGGGGYRFYELAPTLVLKDDFGQAIINPAYKPEMLAAAVSVHEGYVYEPDKAIFWKQAHSSDKSFLFVTTNHVTADYVDTIHQQMKDDEFLVISCKSFDAAATGVTKNVAIKKIPQSLLKDCEYGKDDYSLNIVNPPEYEDDDHE